SPDIDKTTEAVLDRESKPGTITAPKRAESSPPVSSTKSLKTDTEGVIELKVAPRLPENNSLPDSTVEGLQGDEPLASMRSEEVIQDHDKIVLMQVLNKENLPG